MKQVLEDAMFLEWKASITIHFIHTIQKMLTCAQQFGSMLNTHNVV